MIPPMGIESTTETSNAPSSEAASETAPGMAAQEARAERRDDVDAARKRRILNRLRRLEGQVRGLQRMVDEDRTCQDVLTLLSGVRSALDATADAVLEHYLETCATDLGGDDDGVEELLRAVRLARG